MLSVPGWTTGWTIFFDKHRYLDTIKHNLSVIGTIFLHNNVFTQLALPNILEKVGLFTSPAMKTVETTARYLSTRINVIG